LLGVQETVFLGYPDQELEDDHPLRRDLVRVIRRFKPQVVATTDPHRKYMWHRDHRVTGLVTLDAVFPFARGHLSYPELIEEGLEPHTVEEMWFWGADELNLRLDITATLETKLAALACHKSQIGDLAPELKERILDYARWNARGESFEWAEAFHRIEMHY
jgi:LmbE family N-acetylglucosaminyl deacetylase